MSDCPTPDAVIMPRDPQYEEKYQKLHKYVVEKMAEYNLKWPSEDMTLEEKMNSPMPDGSVLCRTCGHKYKNLAVRMETQPGPEGCVGCQKKEGGDE